MAEIPGPPSRTRSQRSSAATSSGTIQSGVHHEPYSQLNRPPSRASSREEGADYNTEDETVRVFSSQDVGESTPRRSRRRKPSEVPAPPPSPLVAPPSPPR